MNEKTIEALNLALEALRDYRRSDDDRVSVAMGILQEALALVNKVDQDESSGTERPAIPTVITCPFCESQHVPGWLHDYNMDRGAYGEQPAQPAQGCEFCSHPQYAGTKCKNCGREQPEQQCNPHPKAPHGFDRNASHSADRYVCECEGWDAYEAGYQAGIEKALEFDADPQPAQQQEPSK